MPLVIRKPQDAADAKKVQEALETLRHQTAMSNTSWRINELRQTIVVV